MLGNLGRTRFSASTSRLWSYSYDECGANVVDQIFQHIGACAPNSVYGMNPNRGAPEIDIMDEGGLAFSSSLQIVPGIMMVIVFFHCTRQQETSVSACTNTTVKLRASTTPTPQNHSTSGSVVISSGTKISVRDQTTTANPNPRTPRIHALSPRASGDVNAVLEVIDGKGKDHWSTNSIGTCYPLMSSYMSFPRNESTPNFSAMISFNRQMNTISSNWLIHFGAYTGFYDYRVEWVTSKNGYN
ncbi:LOW QUALITY PROTEIN: Beta-glucan synthesis-associated protein [Phytophthora megakarya]|uniref:Beta-glucan synthesis-associated protein n=1 Tax=Phytophthora megakarya TaxID=4795 RepID=A0A225UZW9_9STRA|nr:LOW QUALITY PROTEIN: Beta-glucan synthesis-associated protein [Phytophthora megakarya]